MVTYQIFFVDRDGVFLFDDLGPTPDVAEWADLFVGLPAPDSSAFLGLCRFCDAHRAAVNAALPWLAAEIGSNDGYITMLRFIHRWSGMRLYVSKDRAQFIRKIGFEVGEATHRRLIEDAAAGSQIEVPSAWGVFTALRRVAIVAALRSGWPPDEVSRRFGVTMRSLR